MRFLLLAMLLIYSVVGQGQYLDIAKLETTQVPGKDANIQYSRYRALFNVPIELKPDTYLLIGADFSNINFEYKETTDSFDKTNTENFKALDINLTYTFKMNKNWVFGVQAAPSFISNLEGSLIREDFLVSGLLVLVKDMKDSEQVRKPYRIITGMFYNTNSRFPAPIPFFTYYRKFHRKWSYSLGAPYSNLQFHASEKHRIKAHAEWDGFNTSLQGGVNINDSVLANRLRMFFILAGFRYEYNIAKHIESFVNIMRTLRADVQLRDGRTNVLNPEVDDVMHYRMGVRVKI